MSEKSQWPVIATLCGAVIVCALEISMLFPSLPALIRQFGDPATVMWTVTIHYMMAPSSVAVAVTLLLLRHSLSSARSQTVNTKP